MSRQLFASLLMFAWLTLGYAVVHGVFAIWSIYVLQAFAGESATSEHLQVFEDDGPLIYSYDGRSRRVTYRRLDRMEVSGPIGKNTQSGCYFGRDVPGEPASWDKRIAPFLDFQSPAVNWYLIAPPNRSNSAYFIGYEQLSNRLVGYLGTQGFSTQQPSIEQSFPLQTSVHSAFSNSLAATQGLYQYPQPHEPADTGHYLREQMEMVNAPIDAVWLLADGTVYEIRLGAQSVRKLLEDEAQISHLARTTVKRDGRMFLQLILRTDRGLAILDPETLEKQIIPLDPPSPSLLESYYQLENGQRLLVRMRESMFAGVPATAQILWLDQDGAIERSAEVALARGSSSFGSLAASLVLPVPAVPIAASLIAPLASPRTSGEPASYWGRVAYFIRHSKLWFVTSLAIGLISGWSCRRRECDVFHNDGWFWPVLVGLCGWFGWMGYICLHPLPSRLPDGSWLHPQPEPIRPLGTEIFA